MRRRIAKALHWIAKRIHDEDARWAGVANL
jgi:hypothetical protein